jgi:hypothetical protein
MRKATPGILSHKVSSLKCPHKLFHADASLPQQGAQSSAFDRPMHRHDNDASARSAHYVVRTALVIAHKGKTPEGSDGFRSVDIRRNLHASTSSGSVTKCSFTLLGPGTPAARK